MRLAIYSPVMSDRKWSVGSFRTEEICRALSRVGVEGIVASPFMSERRRIAPTFDAVPLPLSPIDRLKSFIELARGGDYDIIQERPFSEGILWNGCGLAASVTTGLPFVLELHNIGTPYSFLKRFPMHFASMWHCDMVLSYSDISKVMPVGAARSKIVRVPNGYSSELIESVVSQETDSTKYEQIIRGRKAFGFFGGLTDNKGIDILLRVADMLAEDEGICFIFAGKGPLENRISQISNRQGSNVIFLGLLDRYHAIACMSKCRATFAINAPWQSRIGNPVKVVESLALGVIPIVNADLVIPEKLKKHCALLRDCNPQTIADMVLRVSSSNDRHIPFGMEDFSIEQIAKDVVLPAYESVVR